MAKKGRLGSPYWSGLRQASESVWDELNEAEKELNGLSERDRARAERADARRRTPDQRQSPAVQRRVGGRR